MKIELSPQEGRFLAALLRHSLDELHHEIQRTPDSQYKAGLKVDVRFVEHLIHELRTEVTQSPQIHF